MFYFCKLATHFRVKDTGRNNLPNGFKILLETYLFTRGYDRFQQNVKSLKIQITYIVI